MALDKPLPETNDSNNMEKLERMSAKRKFKEEDENEEAEKIDIDVYCIMCQTYGHIPSEECVVRAVCFSCGFKGHVRRDCKEGRLRLKNIKNEEIKQESIKIEEMEQGTIKMEEVKEESSKCKNECVEAEVLKDEPKNDAKKIKLEVYCNLCQIYGHILSKACIANAICFVCGIKGHIGRYCKEEKYEFKVIKSEVKNEVLNYEDKYIKKEVEMSGVKNSINEEAHKRPGDHINEMCDLPSDLMQKMTPTYCGLCFKSINGKVVSKAHYEGKPHKKKLKLLEMEWKQHKPVPFKCYLCQVSCTSQENLKAHLNGKAHKKKLDFIEKGQNPASISHVSSEEPPEQKNVVEELGRTFVTETKECFKLEIKEERVTPEIKKLDLKLKLEEEKHGSVTPKSFLYPSKMSQHWRNDFGAMSYVDDIQDFRMTRLSDVIGNVPSEGSLEDTNIDQEIVKKQVPASINAVPSMKYGEKELLVLGTSSLCKLPPPNLTNLPAAMVKSSGQEVIQEERKKKKKKRRKARETKPYDPLNDNRVNPLFRKDSKDECGDNSNDELSKMVVDEDNNQKSSLQERPHKSGLGISHHLFHKAVADLTKQRN